ncbi:MAG: hypothetical protein DCC68_24515 [Planctomycetota bacterium]|nr:MAG: hypothetical protein DCC68_24515 [Planctomycetota bacterium]
MEVVILAMSDEFRVAIWGGVVGAAVTALFAWAGAAIAPPLWYFVTRWLLGPKLVITGDVSNFQDDCDPTKASSYLRLSVTNTKSRSAKNCRCYLTDIEIEGKVGWTAAGTSVAGERIVYRDCLPLIWSYDTSLVTCDIPMGVSRHVDIFSVEWESDAYVPRFWRADGTVLEPTEYAPIFQSGGTRRFTVLITADHMPAIRKQIIATTQTFVTIKGESQFTDPAAFEAQAIRFLLWVTTPIRWLWRMAKSAIDSAAKRATDEDHFTKS